MGFGHRVYKTYDPRAKIMEKICNKVLKKLDRDDPLLPIAKKLEATAVKDPYFIDHNLYPKWKLHRPRQIYVGPKKRDYIPLSERG